MKDGAQDFDGEYERIKTLMDQGTSLRENTNQLDIVARLGVASIRSHRKQLTGAEKVPSPRTAYIVSSFKRPEEVNTFREIYGKAFSLISVYSPRNTRIRDLSKKLKGATPNGKSADELAVELITIDSEEEGRKSGQRVGKTFPLADYFVVAETRSILDTHLLRMVRLTFGDPYISPTRDEQGMFFAQAAALRSLDLSRQVGAAITDDDGAIISTGCNDVPKYGGGLYWGEDLNRSRDFEIGFDSNVLIKKEMLEDVFGRLKKEGWLKKEVCDNSNKSLADQVLVGKNNFFKNSLLFDVIEFGRAVHAEAAAISEAARRGVALQDGKLFCTTFPCHICARHILASGIKKVVFIEPYEKSRTGELYSDSVSVEPSEESHAKANFQAFVGVAPRRYLDLFKMAGDRKKADGKILGTDEIAENPKVRRIVLTYLLVEDIIISEAAEYNPSKKEKK